MHVSTSFPTLLAIFAASASAIPITVSKQAAQTTLTLQQQLELAGTAVDRLALIPNDQDFVFDFNASTTGITAGQGGKTVKADRDTFPALIGSHASMTLGFLGPCGFNTPHVHPRAAELNIVVQGRLMGSVTAENGARHMQHTLNQYQMTVFPQGALHTEWNPDCEPAVFVAAFPNEDPGVQQAAQTFFGFEDDVIQAALGGDGSVNGQDLDKFKALIPPNVALGVESCLKKCNIGTTRTNAVSSYILRGLNDI
ncbi:hypothetical protein OIDMADRAFT_184605 [Oidiodendron maius Zn]|uniref:Cupin type-1 domain-containing protein n=1 Tax=Oidiodendron maius (strain Zn) TaxID=913774 RepID=A0A0C3GCL7_OIDMZ|nr:hypothetical protein OIDMADRAFT_184605 [Oidiodendron maius Zn]